MIGPADVTRVVKGLNDLANVLKSMTSEMKALNITMKLSNSLSKEVLRRQDAQEAASRIGRSEARAIFGGGEASGPGSSEEGPTSEGEATPT